MSTSQASCVNDSSGNAFVEGVVCQESEIPENGMKVCDLGTDGGKVLLIKQNGKLNAIGTKCSHYGAPLITGVLGSGRVRCPWHGACFNTTNGDIEDFPGLDSIPCYKVEVVPGGGVKVRARKSELASNKRLKEMASRDMNNNNTFVIIGGGAAGQCCAETLRQEGFTGRLVMLCGENALPYDRIKLSKMLNATAEKLKLRSDAFYKEHDIELMLGTKATSLDSKNKTITLENGQSLSYNAVFMATGCVPRKIDIPGSSLINTFTLRTLSDAEAIHKVITPESNVVVYGSSFIGMEIASYCCGKVASVTVVGRSLVPFAESLGNQLGARIAQLFKDKGVELRMGLTIEELIADDKGCVKQVNLSDGTSLPSNIVVFGLGSNFATKYLVGSEVNLNQNGSVPTNQFLETNVAGVYAGGDIAHAPVLANNNEQTSIGHWQLAHYHGRIAAFNMLGKAKPLATVPFFWTMLFGTGFRYAGYSAGYDDVVVVGDLDALKCAVYYCKGNDVIAVTTVGYDPIAARFAELLSSGDKLTKDQLSDDCWSKK